ncbi:hydroxyacid dehydrogenase [Streptomyces ziwulingensis]|uniref:Hydroxyacid dehydrogenase n=1 Tax=Streptomyces ziwulingensis TaxID=1045501 RepID=A0ABP9CJH0_9ACTN
MSSAAMSRRPRAAVLLTPALREDLFGGPGWKELDEVVEIVVHDADADTLLAHPRRALVEILITSWGAPRLTAEVLDALPALHTVVHAAGSVRALVTDAVWERGLVVVSAADANNEPVAEYVYAQTVLALKDAHRRSRHIAATRTLPPVEGIPGIYGQPVGLVSFGSVARKVAARLHRLETDVRAWDPYQDPGALREAGVTAVGELADLLAGCRVVSVHTPLIPGRTEKLITGELLRLLPRGATLVNTARGAVIDEEALIEVLTERPDLFAVLDVTAEEPPAPDSALHTLPNVILTGHVAGTVGGERRAMGRLVTGELRRLAAGSAPLHAVSAREAGLRA